jgi:short-subunit dehydrogenase
LIVTIVFLGIGAELVDQLAQQGLNVVLVALADDLLDKHHKSMQSKYPKLQFRKVGVDLTNSDSENTTNGYMHIIKENTKDIDVGAVFSNAGFFAFGNFDTISLNRHLGQVECNMMAGVKLTHHFFSLWKQSKRRGLISYTVSSVAFFPSPYSVIYGASKAFLKNFIESFAVEASHHGVDVLEFSPQYTRTKLYDKTMKLGILDLFAYFGSEPADVARCLLQSVGKVTHREQGAYSIFMKIVGGLMFDLNILTPIMSFALKLAPEYKKLQEKSD